MCVTLTDKPRVTFVWPGRDAAAASRALYVHEGAALALQCAADANPASVAWRWSWSNASNATAAPAAASVSANGSLALDALSRTAAGTYSCEASNDVGAAAASLRVLALCTHTAHGCRRYYYNTSTLLRVQLQHQSCELVKYMST